MEHAALEDNIFARKIIKKKILYFKSKVTTVDSTGEVITYAIAIDKSKALHLECEGTEAHHFMENCEEFIDDVATKRIDPKLLRELPEELTRIKKGIKENKEKQTTFDENLRVFSDTIEFYSENIKTHINAMTSLTESVDQLTEATEKIEKAAEAVEKTAEALIKVIGLLKKTLERNTKLLCNLRHHWFYFLILLPLMAYLPILERS
jgi:methyl-accepting chemotaxis protein